MALATIQEAVNSTVFLITPKENKRSNHKQGYYHTYCQNNRQKILTYSHDYYGVKKLIETYNTNSLTKH